MSGVLALWCAGGCHTLFSYGSGNGGPGADSGAVDVSVDAAQDLYSTPDLVDVDVDRPDSEPGDSTLDTTLPQDKGPFILKDIVSLPIFDLPKPDAPPIPPDFAGPDSAEVTPVDESEVREEIN